MKKTFTAIIVDDEELARIELTELLSAYDNIKVTGTADSVQSAAQLIDTQNPDIVFLDIQMPGASGFDLLDQIKTTANIIFVTAYNEFAIKAFEVNALDYLIKPVYPERLAKSIERITADKQMSKPDNKLHLDDLIFVKTNDQIKFVKIQDILYISSAKEYTEINTISGFKSLLNKPMHEWETRLPSNNFLRIHRTAIININFITSIKETGNKAYQISLRGVEFPFNMSKRYYKKIKDKLQ